MRLSDQERLAALTPGQGTRPGDHRLRATVPRVHSPGDFGAGAEAGGFCSAGGDSPEGFAAASPAGFPLVGSAPGWAGLAGWSGLDSLAAGGASPAPGSFDPASAASEEGSPVSESGGLSSSLVASPLAASSLAASSLAVGICQFFWRPRPRPWPRGFPSPGLPGLPAAKFFGRGIGFSGRIGVLSG